MVLAFLPLFSWHGKNLGESIQIVSSREDSISSTRERRTVYFKAEPLLTAINSSWLKTAPLVLLKSGCSGRVMPRSVSCAEKLQLYTERDAVMLEEWNHQ